MSAYGRLLWRLEQPGTCPQFPRTPLMTWNPYPYLSQFPNPKSDIPHDLLLLLKLARIADDIKKLTSGG